MIYISLRYHWQEAQMLKRIVTVVLWTAIGMCAISCSTVTPPAPQLPELSEAPGFELYCNALEAYRNYEDIMDMEKGHRKALRRERLPSKESIERRKREYLAIADKDARAATELNPDLAQAHMLMGVICIAAERYDDALAEFDEVLRIDPLADNAWVNIAHVYRLQGKFDKALQAVNEALKVNPQSIGAARLHDVIEKKKRDSGRRCKLQFHPRLSR